MAGSAATAKLAGERSVLRAALGTFGAVILGAWVVCALAVVAFSFAPRAVNHQVLIVRSGSMEPAIHTGSVVVVKPVTPQSVAVGDVITYERADAGGIVVTHRVVAVLDPSTAVQPSAAPLPAGRGPAFRTKGDANADPDTYIVQYRDTAWKVIGSVPFAGYFYNALSHPSARAVLVGIPALLLTVSFLRDIWRRPA